MAALESFYIYMLKTVTYTSLLELKKIFCSILKIQKCFGYFFVYLNRKSDPKHVSHHQ